MRSAKKPLVGLLFLAILLAGCGQTVNLASDPGFEEDNHWVLSNGATYQDSASFAHSGARYVFLDGGFAPSASVVQEFNGAFAVGGKYTVRFFVHSNTGTGVACKLGIDFVGSGTSVSQTYNITSLAWAEQTYTGTIPSGTTYFRLYLENLSGSGKSLCVDDATFSV